MALLELKDVSFAYPQSEKKAISNVSLSVERGEVVALVGANGSGKSTLARLVAGLIAPDSGTVTLEQGVLPGIVFQQPKEQIVAGVVERDTAFGPQNLAMSKSEIELRTMECLAVTGLVDKASSRTFELSLGQTQRLAFSGILALFPDFLILDEVTAMLDPDSRKEILALIDEWHRKGHTVLHVTHDKDEALAAQRIIVLDKGTVLFNGRSTLFKKNKKLIASVFGDDTWCKKTKKTIRSKNNALAASDISFSYPNLSGEQKKSSAVFEHLSLTLQQGTLTALTGPSGCGKSTLLECLAGLLSPQQGTIYASERPVLALQESEAALFETFAADDVAFGPRNKGLSGKLLFERVKQSFSLVGLPYEKYGDRQVSQLSGGEKRKVSLAGIIALDSSVLLFDEPTAGLDPQSRVVIMQTLRMLAQNGKTVLFSTHRAEEAAFADRTLTWNDLTASHSERALENMANLLPIKPLPNAEMIHSLQKTTAAFSAPPHIPNSPIQKMAPVMKYIVFLALFISALAVKPVYLCGVVLILCVAYALLAKYPLCKPLLTFVKLVPWLLVFSLFQFLFFPAAQGEHIFYQLGIFTVSMSKILLVVKMFIRTAAAIICLGTFIFTTGEREILDGLDMLLHPLTFIKIPVRYAVLVVGIIFRFIPLLLDEAAGILKTQLIRGGLSDARGLKKVKKLLPLFVPLMMQTFRKAQSFSDALTARYFS